MNDILNFQILHAYTVIITVIVKILTEYLTNFQINVNNLTII